MSADIKSLRNRIKSVDSTLHLTKAMGLVASSKIRKALDAMSKGRQYEEAITNLVSLLTQSAECVKSPFMATRQPKRTRIVIIAGDRGLAGGYNANVFRLSKDYEDCEFIPIGKRACDRFSGEKYFAESFSLEDANVLAKKLCDEFAEGIYDRLGIISTKYVSMMSQDACIDWVLPLIKNESVKNRSILFEPDEITILNTAVCEYVSGILISRARESFASEVAARRFAMDSAGKNAQEMIDDLKLQYNRARQGAITQELTEIVAGSGI